MGMSSPDAVLNHLIESCKDGEHLIFLYEWWPIRAEARLYGRLSAMPVRIEPGKR